jgi:hypothetical protein
MKCAKPTWKQMFIILTYANMKMKRTWQDYGARKTNVEQTEGKEGSYFYLYTFGDIAQGSFYVCIK